MRSIPRVSRPAVLPSAMLLTGVALGPVCAAGPFWPFVAGGSVGLLALALRRMTGLRGRIGLCAALLLLGLGIESADRVAGERRRADCLPPRGQVLEGHVRGRLVAAAEPGDDGSRWLLLRAHVERDGAASGAALRLRLHVAASPSSPTRRLDALDRGDRVRVWCRLRRPRAFGNPGAGDPALRLRASGLDAIGSVKSARLVERLGRADRSGSPVDRIKRFSRERLDRVASGEARIRSVLGAILLGDRAALPPDTVRGLRASGLVHLLAISGLHVGLIAVAVVVSCRRSGRGAWILAPLAAAALCLFSVVVGARPSVLRAVLGALALLLGRHLGREGDGMNTLALAASLLVLAHPGTFWNSGFQLSFLAASGILLWRHPIAARIPLPGPIAGGIAVSLAAYAATAPVVATTFGGLAPAGIALNLVSVPLCALILAAGYGSILLLDVPWIGAFGAWLCRTSVEGLVALGERVAEVEWGYVGVGAPNVVLVALYYGIALALSTVRPRSIEGGRRPAMDPMRGGLLFGFALAIAWLHLAPAPPAAGPGPEAAVIDVGQGQAVAVRGPDGGVILIDAGGGASRRFDPGERVVLPLLRRWGVRRVEVLAVTHGDADHAGGALAILRELEVGEMWLGPAWHRDPRLERLAAEAVVRGVALRLVARGDRTRPAGLPVRVLGPAREQVSGSANDRSLVLMLGVAPARLLIPGDLELDGERILLAADLSVRAEALVLAHHGSRSGSGNALLERVAPHDAVASCGAGNRFAHPHPDVLRRLGRRGVTLWRTDRGGLIRLRAERDGWRISRHLE